MPRSPFSLIALTLVLLSACTDDPAQRCAGAELRERETVERLIADTRAKIDRGYVMVEDDRNVNVNLCLGSGGSHVGVSFCTDPGSRRHAVAVDTATETRKLEALLARREVLDKRIAQLSASCPAS